MEHKKKYLKYKFKYLQAKKILKGGMFADLDDPEFHFDRLSRLYQQEQQQEQQKIKESKKQAEKEYEEAKPNLNEQFKNMISKTNNLLEKMRRRYEQTSFNESLQNDSYYSSSDTEE